MCTTTTGSNTVPSAAAADHRYLHVKVSNVKGHFFVKTPLPADTLTSTENKGYTITHHSNFSTVKLCANAHHSPYVYVVFPKRGYVNVSGIRDFNECELARVKFEHVLGVKAITKFRIDNSTASGQFPFQRIHLPDLLRVQTNHRGYPCTISLRPHYFPAALVRPLDHVRRRRQIGTCILFANSKFIVVGSRSPAQTAHSVHNLQSLVYSAKALQQQQQQQ